MSEQHIVVSSGSRLTSILSFALVALLIGAVIVGYFAYKSLMDENAKLQNEVVQFKQLTESLVRSSTKWATKKDLETDLKDLMTKDDLKLLQKDLDKLDSRLTAVGRTVGSVKRKVAKLEASDREGKENPPVKICKETGDPIDVHGYTKKVQIKELKDSNTAPVARAEFDAAKKKPWNYEVYGKEYKLTTVVGKKDSGQMTFHHQLKYAIPSKDPNKLYPVNILSSDYKQVPEKSKWFWLNPRLDVNFIAGGAVYKFADGPGRSDNILSMGADVGISLSSYGPTKVDSWFRMFRFGLGYNIERQAASLSFAPFAFNLGKPLPLLTNLYLTPQVAIDTGGGLTVNMGIGPQF
jgi:hypothetical protein